MNSEVISHKCQICASNVRTSWSFGAIVCDACKKFFAKSEQTNAYQKFKCDFNRDCSLISAGIKCQYCRYQKCKQVGMDIRFRIIPNSNLEQELCLVCKRPPSGIHFGVLACAPCKDFFIRSNRDNKYQTYECNTKKSCSVEFSVKCTHCRFQKCIQSGMSYKKCKVGRYSNIQKNQNLNNSYKLTLDRVESNAKRFKANNFDQSLNELSISSSNSNGKFEFTEYFNLDNSKYESSALDILASTAIVVQKLCNSQRKGNVSSLKNEYKDSIDNASEDDKENLIHKIVIEKMATKPFDLLSLNSNHAANRGFSSLLSYTGELLRSSSQLLN